jgi:hypothetical protein
MKAVSSVPTFIFTFAGFKSDVSDVVGGGVAVVVYIVTVVV